MKKFIIIILISAFSFFFIQKALSQQGYNVYNTPQQYRISPSAHQENIMIILDCSLSMEDEIHGRGKLEIAKEVISKVLSQISPNIAVGLRAYGHKREFLKSIVGMDKCEVSELLVPINPNNHQRIANAMSKLRPVGMTPICYSIDQSVTYDFSGLSGKKRIILITDGMETCNGSPCEFAVELIKREPDVSIDVIGFDLASDPAAIKHLRCAALVTNGKFYTADNPDEFLKSFQQSFRTTQDVQGKIMTK